MSRGLASGFAHVLTGPQSPTATPAPGDVRGLVPPYEYEWDYLHREQPAFTPQRPLAGVLARPDLDADYIGRTPANAWNEQKKWPDSGENVTFEAHIANRGGSSTGSFTYVWYVDGVEKVRAAHGSLLVGAEDVLRLDWTWESGVHTVKLTLDPGNRIAEVAEGNNVVEDRTNALTLGIWVEQAMWDFFNQHVVEAGWGGNSFDDWIQRHAKIWNQLFASAVYPLTPNGILDRVRVGKIVRVPNGTLGCQSNFPADDKTVDLIWGFPSDMVGVPSPANCTQWTPGYRDNRSTWDRDMGLLHEWSHARYLIDLYGLDLGCSSVYLRNAIDASSTQLAVYQPGGVPIEQNEWDFPAANAPHYLNVEGELISCSGKSGDCFTGCTRGAEGTQARPHAVNVRAYSAEVRLQDGSGKLVAGTSTLPYVNNWGILYYNKNGDDLMGGYGGGKYSEHSAMAWNLIAGQRPCCGNANAPGNLGAYLKDIPADNRLRLTDKNGNPLRFATVRVYRPRQKPAGYYSKYYLKDADAAYMSDANGMVDLGSNPFGPEILMGRIEKGLLMLEIESRGTRQYFFREVTDFNLAYWRGHHDLAEYEIRTNLSSGLSSPTPSATCTTTRTPVPGVWEAQTSGTTAWLYSIQFLDGSHGWAGGEGGLVLGTEDGGGNWSTLSSGGSTVSDMKFVDADHGWRVSWGTIERTTDGGRHWERQYSTSQNLVAVDFVDVDHGWAVGGEGGWILRTSDGGASWSPVQMPLPWSYLQDVCFRNSQEGWTVGWGGNILHASDGGLTWERRASGTGTTLEGITFANDVAGWIMGWDGTILHTSDGGATWLPQSSRVSVSLGDGAFVDGMRGWVIGDRGTILHTSGGGATWVAESSGVDQVLQSISVSATGFVWVCGRGGVILRRAPDVQTGPSVTPTRTASSTVTRTATPTQRPTATPTESPTLGPTPADLGFSDMFDTGALRAGWTWVDNRADCGYTLTERPGWLRVRAPGRGHDLSGNLDAPRLMQPISASAFVVSTRLEIPCGRVAYRGAGLVIWKDSSNYLRLERECWVGGINLIYRLNGEYVGVPNTPEGVSSAVSLQVRREGDEFQAYYSPDGRTWIARGSLELPWSGTLLVGVAVLDEWQDDPAYADFDCFCVGECLTTRVFLPVVLRGFSEH